MMHEMNEQLVAFARETIKDGLASMPETHHHRFKQMYANSNFEMPINEVVDNMPKEKLNWAMTQIENTLNSLQKREESSNGTTEG